MPADPQQALAIGCSSVQFSGRFKATGTSVIDQLVVVIYWVINDAGSRW